MSIRVLVADDEHEIRTLIVEIIENTLPKAIVTQAENGYDAFLYLGQHKYDLVITDIKMPGVDGLKLVDSIQEMDEETQPEKILVISGKIEGPYSEGDVTKTDSNELLFHFLSKPFHRAALVRYLKDTFYTSNKPNKKAA